MDSLSLLTIPPDARPNLREQGQFPPTDVDAILVWPRGGNVGDLLIVSACERFLRDQGLTVWRSDGSIEFAALVGDGDYIDGVLDRFNGIVCFPGGGNVGIYHDNDAIRAAVISRLRPHHRCLVFPQSAVAPEATLVHPRVTVWCRDVASRDLLRRSGATTELVPDIALYLDDLFAKVPGGEGVFYARRGGGAELPGRGLDYDAPSADLTMQCDLEHIVASLTPYETVLTDRLHAGLIALMMSKQVVLLPVNYHKIEAFYRTWLNDAPSVGFASNEIEITAALDRVRPAAMDWRALFSEHAEPAFERFRSRTPRAVRAAASPKAAAGRPSAGRGIIAGTAGVCMVRDSIDIIPAICGHYLRTGFEHLRFVDDGSSDGTFEFLDRMSRRTSRVSVVRLVGDHDPQLTVVSETVNDLIASGLPAVFPFDADEFWDIGRSRLRTTAAKHEPRVMYGSWVNFVQSRDELHPRPFGLLSIRRRAEAIAGVGMADVQAFRQPFVSIHPISKVAVWSREPVLLSKGQHTLIEGPTTVDRHRAEMFHVPLRWRSELSKRALNYEPRRIAKRSDAGENWQSQFHRDIVLDGRDGAVWAANSHDHGGFLDVYGRAQATERDIRLRRLIARAALYMLRAHRIVAF